MRFIFLSSIIILIACLFPQNAFALLAYVCIALYSIFSTFGLLRKASPQVKRQALIVSSGAVAIALGIGLFVYFT